MSQCDKLRHLRSTCQVSCRDHCPTAETCARQALILRASRSEIVAIGISVLAMAAGGLRQLGRFRAMMVGSPGRCAAAVAAAQIGGTRDLTSKTAPPRHCIIMYDHWFQWRDIVIVASIPSASARTAWCFYAMRFFINQFWWDNLTQP